MSASGVDSFSYAVAFHFGALGQLEERPPIAQLKDRIAKTIDYLKSMKQNEIDGTETKDISITFPSGQTGQFTGQSLLLCHSLPNFYFHAATAYDIIRQCGVEIGKRDFMGTPST